MRIAQRSNLCVRDLPTSARSARARLLRWLDSNRMRVLGGALARAIAPGHRERRARTPGNHGQGCARTDSFDGAQAAQARRRARRNLECGSLPRSAHSRQAAALCARCLREPVRRRGARITWTRSPKCSTCSANYHDSAVRTEMFAQLVTQRSARAGSHLLPRRSTRGTRSTGFRKVPAQIREGLSAQSGGAAGGNFRKRCVRRCAPRAPRRSVRPRPDGCLSRQARDRA